MNRIKKVVDLTPRQLYTKLYTKIYSAVGTQFSVRSKREQQPVCLFVLSTGRVGTKTLAALLSEAEGAFVYHEPAPHLYQLSYLAYRYATTLHAQPILDEAFNVARFVPIQYALSCGKSYVETSPQVTFLAPNILHKLPQAKFIHLTRNPQAVVRSGVRRNWFGGHASDQTRIVPREHDVVAKEWLTYSLLQKNAWLWAETNQWILDFCSTLQPDQYLRVQAEEMFTQDQMTLQRLFDFLGSTLPANGRVQQILGQKLNAQQTGAFPHQQQWSAELGTHLTNIVDTVASDLGYERL